MSFTKWIRKNKQPVMVVVVIVGMIVFVMGSGGLETLGSLFQQTLTYLGFHGKNLYATYYDNGKITGEDLYNARQELEVLKAIRADTILFNKPNAYGMTDINSLLLGYLLFGGDSQSAAQIRSHLRQSAQYGRIPLTTSQIDAYFDQQPEQSDVTWILLCAEAQKAGIAVSNDQAAEELKGFFKAISGGSYTAAQVIEGVAAQLNLTNDQILAVYAKLQGILKWSEQVCNIEDTTLAQIRSVVGHSKNRIDVEFAKFPADWFISKQAEPTDQQIQTQFNMYKDILPGQLMDQNPYGFGYKLPKRVQLEYLYVRSDDAKKIAKQPTPEVMEEYYAANINQFTSSTPVDPNKPDGDKITQTKSFVEVSEEIRRILEEQNTDKLVQLIFKDVRDLLDAEIINLDMEKASIEEIRKAAADFETAAAKITEKYKVQILTGKTGLLSSEDFASDYSMAGLRINNAGIQTSLMDAVFAIDPQNTTPVRKVGVYIPRMWENIGPMEGTFYSETYRSTPVTVICRVVDVRPSEAPASIDLTYSTAGISTADTQDPKKIFNLKQRVIDDLKKTSALLDAKAAAEEFKQLVAQTDWDKAVEKYNSLHAPADPNTVKDKGFRKLSVTPQKNQMLASSSEIAQIQQVIQDDPARANYFHTLILSNMLNQKLFDMLADKTQTGVISELIELKPAMSCYVIKSITRQPATVDDFNQSKSYAALRTSMDSATKMAMTHFNPAQILKRLDYKKIEHAKTEDTESQETPVEK